MRLMREVCACAAAAVLTAGSAGATGSTALARADVPFEFVVNGRTLPAGVYTISPSSAAGVVVIQGEQSRGSIMAVGGRVSSTTALEAPRLVFVKRNGKLHLSQVLPQFSGNGASFRVK